MCDYDPPDFFRLTEPRARKLHRCSECFHLIEKGEKYIAMSGKWDGDVSTTKFCSLCPGLFEYCRSNDLVPEATFSHPASEGEPACLYYGELHECVRAFPDKMPEHLLSDKMKVIRDKYLEKAS